MKHAFLILAGSALIACGEGAPPTSEGDQPEQPATAPTLSASAKVFERIDLPNLDDNVKHDTLLIYTTHALGDGTFIMAAKHMDDKPEGLRLYLYKHKPDSSAEILAYTKPGFDSYTMLPVYFKTSDANDGWIIITNMGEKQSWGQEAFLLKDGRFKHLGWIDVAKRDWKTEDDSTFQWRTSIAPFTAVRSDSGRFEFTFTSDSVQVYDDLKGGQEVVLPASTVQYRYDNGRWWLVINGEAREVKVPA